MRSVVGWILAGGMAAVALAACRDEAAGLDPAGGCTASCAEAIAVGGEPCAYDVPGAMAYDAFVTCAGDVAPPGTTAQPDGGGVCDSVLAGGRASPKCITAVEALMPPCSSAPGTCTQN